MTKSEFVDKVASTSGLSKKDADNAVNAVISTIETSLRSGEDVNFTGFGKFHVADARRPRGAQPAYGRVDDDRRQHASRASPPGRASRRPSSSTRHAGRR